MCRAAPDDPAPWAVYADWLIAREDPTGEMAAMRVAGKDAAADRIFAGKNLLGPHAPLLRVRATDLVWRHGFLAGVTLARHAEDALTLAQITHAFLDLPVARFVETLRFTLDPASETGWAPTAAVVIALPQAPHIRALRLDAKPGRGHSSQDAGDVSAVWARLPALDDLQIRCDRARLGDLQLPRCARSCGSRRPSIATSSRRSSRRAGRGSSTSSWASERAGTPAT